MLDGGTYYGKNIAINGDENSEGEIVFLTKWHLHRELKDEKG